MISGYATGEDYHVSIPTRLAPLVEYISEKDPSAPAPRIYTDSAPILERELAVRAGLGWIGRNSCLISPSLGSNVLLAEIFTGIPLEPDQPFTTDRCGSCTRCVDACPTGCIQPNRTIDSNRCLSYHSIENKGDIPPAVMEKFGSWIFGCDICQMVCPWNHRTVASGDLQITAKQMTVDEMREVLQSSPVEFDRNFAGSAIARTRYSGLMRNIIIRLANMRAGNAAKTIRFIMESQNDPILQRAAGWALEQLNKRSIKKSSLINQEDFSTFFMITLRCCSRKWCGKRKCAGGCNRQGRCDKVNPDNYHLPNEILRFHLQCHFVPLYLRPCC